MKFEKLPSELALEIFDLALHPQAGLPDYRQSDSYPSSWPGCTPLVLGHVSKSWRTLTWASPQLWRFVFLTLKITSYHIQVRLLREWLQRAGEHPLTIHLRGYPSDSDWDSKGNVPYEAFNALCSVSRRWSDVKIFVPYDSRFLSVVQDNLPLLSSLEIRGLQCHPAKRENFYFRNAPQLCSVSISLSLASNYALPWGQLHQIDLRNLNTKHCLKFLKLAENLTSALLWPTIGHSRLPAVVHSRLKNLQVSSLNIRTISSILNATEFPVLTNLDIRAMTGLGYPPDLTRCLTRFVSTCSLRTLHLSSGLHTGLGLIEVLQSTPLLSHLHLQSFYPSSKTPNCFFRILLSALGPVTHYSDSLRAVSLYTGSSSQSFIPELRGLYFRGPVVVDSYLLLVALKYRWRNGLRTASTQVGDVESTNRDSDDVQPIYDMRIDTDSQPMVMFSEEQQQELLRLKEAGLNLILTGTSASDQP